MPTIGKVITLGPLPAPANPAIGYTSVDLFKIPGFEEMMKELFQFPVELPITRWQVSSDEPFDVIRVDLGYINVGEALTAPTPYGDVQFTPTFEVSHAPLHNSPKQYQ